MGITDNVSRKDSEHEVERTKPQNHIEKFDTRQEARDREKYLKSAVSKEYLKLIKN